MTRNDLYSAAFRYKKAYPWKKLWDTDLFAIRLAAGKYGYISIMGHAGDYCALGLYIGDEGFDSLRDLYNTDTRYMDEFQEHEFLLQQKCLQLALENKEDLMPEEVDEARAYAKANGIRLSGKNAFPQFIKYEPGYHPWKVNKTADIDALCQAAEVCILLGETLKTASPADFGIISVNPFTKQVPLLAVEDGQLKWEGYAPIPPEKDKVYENVPFKNDVMTARVKRLPKQHTWETEVIRLLNPVQENPSNAPYYPLFLLTVESGDGYVLPDAILSKDEQDMEQMPVQLAQAFISRGSAPRELKCRDSRTYALLENFCERTGIRLRLVNGKMAMLDEAKYNLLEHITDADTSDELTQMVETFLSLPDDAIETMPQPLIDRFREFLDENELPDELAEQLREKLRL